MNTSVKLCDVVLKNPVMTASGSFGSGLEFAEYMDLNCLGAIVTKGVASVPWQGNNTPRIAETASGMLNAVGLQNPGVDLFVNRDLKELTKYDTNVIVNVCGHTTEEYLEVIERLNSEDIIKMFEINISCPNVKEGGVAFGTNPVLVEKITSDIKKLSKKPVIMKLTPNVTDITEIARAAEAGGADCVSLINTLTGMKIDIERRKCLLANKTGGLSGPAIKPVAVRMVYQVRKAVNIPIIGMGGITTSEDAIEFMMAGANAVAVGTANFITPKATVDIINGIEEFMQKHNIKDINEIVGCVE